MVDLTEIRAMIVIRTCRYYTVRALEQALCISVGRPKTYSPLEFEIPVIMLAADDLPPSHIDVSGLLYTQSFSLLVWDTHRPHIVKNLERVRDDVMAAMNYHVLPPIGVDTDARPVDGFDIARAIGRAEVAARARLASCGRECLLNNFSSYCIRCAKCGRTRHSKDCIRIFCGLETR